MQLLGQLFTVYYPTIPKSKKASIKGDGVSETTFTDNIFWKSTRGPSNCSIPEDSYRNRHITNKQTIFFYSESSGPCMPVMLTSYEMVAHFLLDCITTESVGILYT